jgi:hypothetical protein
MAFYFSMNEDEIMDASLCSDDQDNINSAFDMPAVAVDVYLSGPTVDLTCQDSWSRL